MPDDYPLRAWDADILRVWAEPAGLWVAVANDRGRPIASFGWRPGEPLAPWVVMEGLRPLVDATLAALWRDLRVAGEESVPVTGDDGRERRPRRQGKSSRRQRASRRTLPGRRSRRLRGRRQWGADEERAVIRRRGHGVRGHLRRLQSGWQAGQEARQAAKEFGVLLPDGFTFVRPYYKPGQDADGGEAPAEVVVHSRGLATVMALLR